MNTHATLSPSRRHRFMVCPGSVREEAKYPDSTGPAAIDGTHTHSLLEHCIKGGLADPMKMVGVTLKDHEGEFKVDVERASRVQVATDYIKSRVAQYDGRCEVKAEGKVNPAYLLGRDDMDGTIDVQIIAHDVLELIDYKDGMGIVGAEKNPQLEQYAMGVLAGYKTPGGKEYPFQRVRMTIIQPKLALKGMPAITSHEVDVADILGLIGQMVSEAAWTDRPDAPLVPGDVQCKFCRAKGGCSALVNHTMKEVGVMFQPIEAPLLDVAQQSADKDPATMDDAQIRQIMEAAPLMRQLLEAVEKEALRRMEAGGVIPGLKLVNGRGSRAWALPEEEMADKLVKMGIPKSSVYETKLVSPAKAEKLTWEKRDGTKVQLTDRQLKRMEQEYVVKMAGKITVAPESDSRPAVILNVAPMFDAIETQTEASALPAWLS